MSENVTQVGCFSRAGAEQLHEMAESSEKFTAYLKFHGRMFKHAPSVTLEFFVQKPECRFVASQVQWEKAGNSVVPGSEGIRFRDSHGKVFDLYDFSQCTDQKHEPYQWRMTASGEAMVREKLELPAKYSFLSGLVRKTVSSEIITGAMQRLQVPPQNALAFRDAFHCAVAAIIAGRLEVGGNSFPVQADAAAIRYMTDTQRLGFITLAAVSAKKVLNQVEQIMNDRKAAMQAERMVQKNEIRGVSDAYPRGNGANSGHGAAGSTQGSVAQLSNPVQGDPKRGRSGLGGEAAAKRNKPDMLSAAAEKQTNRQRNLLVSGKPHNRDIRDADRAGRTDDGNGAYQQLRFGMDALDGGELSGESGGNAILSPVSDSGSVSGQESLGVQKPAGQSVPVGESSSAWLRENPGMGADENVLHGQRNHEGHHTSGSHDSVTDKIAQAFQTENPSADQTDGFGKQKYASIPLSPAQEQKIQRNKEEDERFLQSIQAYLRGDYGNETVFRVGTTPYCMRIVGAKAIPVVISQSVLFNSLASGKASKAHTEGHDIPPETLEKIPEAIRNPIFVCRGHRPDTLAVICDLTDKEQRNLLVALALDVQGAHSKVNRITTVFGKKNIAQFVQKTIDSDGILAMNIKKAEKLSSHIGIQSPKSATILCFDDSIPYSDENVKRFSEISSQGTLTHEPKKPITSERRATMLATFAAKHNLEDLNVFVKKDKSYQSDGRAYDLIVKDGKSEVFSTLLFTLEPGEIFTESVLQSGLESLEASQELQDFLASRAAQPSLFDQAEPQKVDTSVNAESKSTKAADLAVGNVILYERVDTSVNFTPELTEKAKKSGQMSRPEQLYRQLSEMYPQLVSGEHTYEHYEADPDSGYEPLSIEQIGEGLYSFMTTYIQNGDIMRDPDITFMLDHNEQTAHVFSFQQDGVPPHGTYYVEVADETGHVDTKLQASLEQTFLQNLKNAQTADRVLTRYHDKTGQETVLIPDMHNAPTVEAEQTEPVKVDENAHLRQVLNAFSEEHGLGELNLRFIDSNHVGIFESYGDGSDMQLDVKLYYGDDAQISQEDCKRILDHFAAETKRRGRKVEDVMSRKSAIAVRGKSELPPVPDVLPEIVYAKAPLQKVRDNIEAIRELQRLARCEAEEQPLYDKKRNQWNCKENSDNRLRKYSGWGGLQQVFDTKSGRYADLRERLQKLLTPEEYTSAKASATDAHYTPQIVIDAMYKAVQNMGIPRDSRVLEPACGTGNFITRMPHSIGNAGVVGVELDPITAQIAARLNMDNPNVEIIHSAFEQSGQTDNSFDLVIGNVPFGDYKMNDPDYTQDWLIHDAFFRKALDKAAPGGVVAFVTSTGTLDKKNPKVREHLASQADLIGAIRLPNTAFSEAGTGVPTDIVFLQKRVQPLSPDAPKPDWCYVTPISEANQDIRINSYFVQNPQMILGTMRKTSFQDRLTCDPVVGTDLKKQLDQAIQQLNAKIIVTKREKAAQERRGYIQPWGKQFTYQVKDQKVYYNEGTTMREITGSSSDMDRLKRLIGLRSVTRQLIDKQKTAAGDHELVPLRQFLNQQYDAFTAKYGNLNSDAVKKAFAADADYALLQSLEEYDTGSKTYYKAEIFHKRTVNPVLEITAVDTLEEAYQVSLDQRGKPNIPYMATLLQAQHPDTPFADLTQQIQKDLLDRGMVFRDPEQEITGEPFSDIVERAEYLSGDIRRKLVYAQDRAAEDPAFQRNIDALRAVIPEDIHAEEIAVRMGCPWIDPEDYTKFLHELSGRRAEDTRCEVKYSPITGEFDILQAGSRKDLNVNEGTTYGTNKLTMYEIAQKMLNQRRIAVMTSVSSPRDPSKMISRTDPVETRKAMEKAKLIETKFSEWIFADPERKAKYERRYNNLFNSLVGRKYDGSHLTFGGQSAAFALRPHQRDCVARAVYGGNTLAAHVVGAGKSAVFQTAVMKKKQLGLINKACVVVPKALTEQTAREWRKLYPDAKLLTMSAADLSSEAKRDLFAARVATGDYDAVIVSVEQFEKMPMSQEFQQKYLLKQLDDLEDMLREARSANGNRKDATTKQIETGKKKLKVRLENIMNPKSKQKGKDILLNFEQLGFDYLVVDEAHGYKNGFVTTKMGNVSGVTTAASGKAQDMQMKCDYFNEQLGQGHLLFCTGTPVSNSMTELYVMLRYLRPDLLAAAGVGRFDDWAATFGKVTTQHKQSATGELKLKTAFSKFANLPELMSMYKEFADIQSAKKLDLPRPSLKTGKPQIISVPASPEQKAFVKALVERAKRISEGSVDPHDDNMLVITNEARLTGLCNAAVAALLQKHEIDVPEGFTDAKTSKVDVCVDKVLQVYQETATQKGVQIVFSDVAVNSDAGNFSVYDYIRDELIAKGIPAEEIIFAPKSEAKNREDIFRDINAGKYRVVIASTSTLGTGANVQERLAAVHHVDIPWKPSDFEQREGRILRQGNSFSEVQIFNYITEGTMDSYLYQVVTDKARFIAQLLDDETPARISEDCDDKVLTYGEMQAAAEGNDNFRKRIELGMKVSELQFAKAEFQRETGEMRKTVAAIPEQVAALRDRIDSIKCDIETVDRMRNPEGKIEDLTVTTATGNTLSKQEDINLYLQGQLIQKSNAPFNEVSCFKINGFQVTVELVGLQQGFAFAVQGESPVAYRTAAEIHDKSNNAQRLLNLLNNGIANEKTKCENRIEKLNTDLIQATERLAVAFPHEQELQQAQSELAQVEAELLGITEMEAAILDPDEQPIEETAEEKKKRESFAKSDDDNDLNPNTSGEILPPIM